MNLRARSVFSINISNNKAILNIFALAVYSIISTIGNAQKNTVKEIKLDSEKFLFSEKAIDYNTQNLNEQQFLEFLAKNESFNQGFKIPESQEIISILSYKTTITNKKKVICDKTFKCSKPIGLYEEAKWGYVQLAFFRAIEPEEIANDLTHGKSDYQKKTHNHSCKNCQDWTNEYKRKVACNVCRDSRRTYCGKIVKCPICQGKGYVLEETDKQDLDINSFLDSYKIEKCEAYLYYNSPKDFGYVSKNGARIKWSEKYQNQKIGIIFTQGVHNIISERQVFLEQQKKNDDLVSKEIELLIEQGKITEASKKFSQLYSRLYYELKYTQNLISCNRLNEAYLLCKSLNIIDENIISQLETKKLINENKIKQFLASNNIDSSIHYYKLNPPDKNIKRLIQDKLSEINNVEEDYVIDEKFVKFVKDSLLNKLDVLKSGDNILHINNKGNCNINDIAGNVKLKFQLPENLMPRKKYDEFEYNINAKSKFSFFADSSRNFVKGLILDRWYESRISKGTVVFYYAKKKKKEFLLSNKLVYKDQAAQIPDSSSYDVLTKLNYFEFKDNFQNSHAVILNAPAYLNGVSLGDVRVYNYNKKIKLKNYKN